MKFLFDNESFSFETLRSTGFAAYGGADLGEVLTTARHIGEGDEASWHRVWKATAQRVGEIGEQALAAGHRVSAREALLRASNYDRTAGDFLLEMPATDPEMTLLSAGQHDTFAAAAALFDTPVQAVAIPYEVTTLPAYLFLVDDSGAARPTIVYNSGYDSTREESYFVIAAAALRRGYNVLGLRRARTGRHAARPGTRHAPRLGSRDHPGRRLRTDPRRDRGRHRPVRLQPGRLSRRPSCRL